MNDSPDGKRIAFKGKLTLAHDFEASALIALLYKGAGLTQGNPPPEVGPFFGLGEARLLGIVYFHLKAFRFSIRQGVAFFFHVFFRSGFVRRNAPGAHHVAQWPAGHHGIKGITGDERQHRALAWLQHPGISLMDHLSVRDRVMVDNAI